MALPFVVASRAVMSAASRGGAVGIEFRGFRELQRFIGQLPESSAGHLQSVIIRNMMDHRNEVARASRFKVLTRSQLAGGHNRGLIRIFPRPMRGGEGATPPKRLRDVEGRITTYWSDDDKHDVLDRIEKSSGRDFITPERKRFLLIPQGDFLTPRGMPRRSGKRGGPITAPKLRDLEDTAVIESSRGLLLIQNLRAKQKGLMERSRGVHKARLGERVRVVGRLVKRARQTKPLDFWGPWDRLARDREARYDRMLDRIIAGQRRRGA